MVAADIVFGPYHRNPLSKLKFLCLLSKRCKPTDLSLFQIRFLQDVEDGGGGARWLFHPHRLSCLVFSVVARRKTGSGARCFLFATWILVFCGSVAVSTVVGRSSAWASMGLVIGLRRFIHGFAGLSVKVLFRVVIFLPLVC